MVDVRKPKLHGYEGGQQVRPQPSTEHIPVVFLLARGQDPEIKHGLEPGTVETVTQNIGLDPIVVAGWLKTRVRQLANTLEDHRN